MPPAYNEAIDGIAVGEGMGSCGTVASRGTPVYASDIATDPLWMNLLDLALSHGLRCCWSTPVIGIDGTVLGIFAIYYHEPRSPTQADIEVITSITQNRLKSSCVRAKPDCTPAKPTGEVCSSI